MRLDFLRNMWCSFKKAFLKPYNLFMKKIMVSWKLCVPQIYKKMFLLIFRVNDVFLMGNPLV